MGTNNTRLFVFVFFNIFIETRRLIRTTLVHHKVIFPHPPNRGLIWALSFSMFMCKRVFMDVFALLVRGSVPLQIPDDRCL